MESMTEVDWTILDWERVGDGLQLREPLTSERLNQIDRVRANGIGDHVAHTARAMRRSISREELGIGSFATEIILRHDSKEQSAVATVIPHASRTVEVKRRLGAIRHQIREFTELPSIIEAAASLIGVRGHSAEIDAPAFSADVLRLALVARRGLHLTVVDLLGLVSVSEVEDDVQLVGNLVDSYLENSRTTILAMVPASSDTDTQGIIQHARHFDKEGYRTDGVITKPNIINVGTESRVLLMNQRQKAMINT